MRLILLLSALAVACLGLWFFLVRATPPTAEAILTALREGDPAFTTLDELRLEGCQFSLRHDTAAAEGGRTSRTFLKADLGRFEFSRGTIQPLPKGKAVLRIARAKPSAPLIAQVRQVLAALPALPAKDGGTLTLKPENGGTKVIEAFGSTRMPEMSEAELRKILGQPGGTLAFNFTEVIVGSDGATPPPQHPDAPAFFDFAEAVMALPDPMTVNVTLLFAEAPPTRETFRSGSVIIPPYLQVRTASLDAAQSLGRMLHDYASANCRR